VKILKASNLFIEGSGIDSYWRGSISNVFSIVKFLINAKVVKNTVSI